MWLPIIGYEWYYEISDDWLVRSVDRLVKKVDINKNIKGKYMALKKDSNWRLQVRLSKWWKTKYYLVHRLVAEHYIWNIKWKVIDHIDDNCLNNKTSNLQIVTQTENMVKREIKINDIEKLWKFAYSIKYLEYNDFII